jgi:EAL domain-containing protein (putative c-di-GMP-specific phosphodiesterase class I)
MTSQATFKKDRDRMVGFAFAMAHLLIEITPEGMVTYATGASCGLVEGKVGTLTGKSLFEMVVPGDRDFLAEVLKRIADRQPPQLVRVTLNGHAGLERDFMLGGIHLEGESILHIGLISTRRRSEVMTASGGDRLVEAAMERIASGGDGAAADNSLMLFVIDEIAELLRNGPSNILLPVLGRLRAFMRAVSAEGDAIKDIGAGKFGLVRASGITREEVQNGIRRILEEAKIASPVKTFELSFEMGDLTESDAARAITYAVRRFADDAPETFTIRSLRDGANAILRDTAVRMTSARQLMRRHSIEVVFQPIVRLEDGKVHHLEALSRISNVESIGTWMRFAEESGLIQDFDLMVASKVAAALAEHAKAGWMPRIAINLSARSLQSSLFLSQFDAVLKPYEQFRRQLLIEVTETAAILNFGEMAQTLGMLRRKGHAVCLDDVGAGTTSFETIQSLPADFMKIDGLLLKAVASGKVNPSTMATMVHMALDKGSEVIAEHVETQAHVRLARDMGIRFGQGFLFGRPVSDASAASIPHGVVDPLWSPIRKAPEVLGKAGMLKSGTA